MKLSGKIYQMIQEARERIIETMRERNITRVNLIMTQEEYVKANGLDNADDVYADYNDYMTNNAPWVIFFNKWGNGVDYAALSVELVGEDHPSFNLNCYNSEEGDDSFMDDNLAPLSMVHVYEHLLEVLGLEY